VALRIVFESGPDKGRSFLLVGEREVRIGRGPGFHIVPHDTGWKGALRLDCSQGVYRVTNEMGYPIFRNGNQTFPVGAREICYDNTSLQPTADTVLRCFIVDDPAGVEETVVEETGRQKGEGQLLQWVLVLLMFPAAGVLFFMPSFGVEEKSPAELRQEFSALSRDLREREQGSTDAQRQRVYTGLVKRLQECRFNEVRGRFDEAFDLYLSAREEVDRLLHPPEGKPEEDPLPQRTAEDDALLQRLWTFVSQRILVLNSRQSRYRR
jgi:hypothetical protein